MKLDTVLVPLDGSPLAEVALAKAVELVNGRATKIILLRAPEAGFARNVVAAQVTALHEAEEYLKGIRERLSAQGVENVMTSVWYGPAAAAIIGAAQMYQPDLIVMNSHGRSGIGRFILGSVAEAVLRGTRTPILLLRDTATPVDVPPGSAHPADGARA